MEESFTCGECSYQNLNLESLIKHMNSEHDAEDNLGNSPNAFFNAADEITSKSKLDDSNSGNTQTENINKSNGENNNLQEARWTTNTTMLLIRLVEKNYSKFDTELKKNVWNRIALELSNMCSNFKVNASQCDSKWKALKATYKKVLEYNSTNDGVKKKWQHFEAMHSILYKSPEIVLPVTCNANGVICVIKEEPGSSIINTKGACAVSEQSSKSTFSRKRRKSTLNTAKPNSSITDTNGTSVTEQSIESNFSRKTSTLNSAAQKRHKEKMQRQDRFIDLYEKLVNFITQTNNNENQDRSQTES